MKGNNVFKTNRVLILFFCFIGFSSCVKTLYYGKEKYDYFDYYLKPYKDFSVGFVYNESGHVIVSIYKNKIDTNKVMNFYMNINDSIPLEIKINNEGYKEKAFYNLKEYSNLINDISTKNYSTLILKYPLKKFERKIKVHFNLSLIYNHEKKEIDTIFVLKRFKNTSLGIK